MIENLVKIGSKIAVNTPHTPACNPVQSASFNSYPIGVSRMVYYEDS